MKRDNIIKILLISFSTLVLLSILGYAYAYFSLQIEGTPKDVIVSTGALRLEYKDEAELKLDGAFPGDSVSKVVTVKKCWYRKCGVFFILGRLNKYNRKL